MRGRAGTFAILVVLAAMPVEALAQRSSGFIYVGRALRDSITTNDAELLGSGRARALRFSAVKGQTISFQVRTAQFTPALAIGQLVGSFTSYLSTPRDWDPATPYLFEVPATDSYFLIVQARDVALPVRFEVDMTRRLARAELKSSNGCKPGASGCAPSFVEGSLSSTSLTDARLDAYYDVYAFSAQAGERLAVAMESDEFDTQLSVGTMRHGLFEELAGDDDGAGGTNSRLVFTAPAAGEYVVRAAGTSKAERGDYRIRLGAADEAAARTASNTTASNATPLCRAAGSTASWTACAFADGAPKLSAKTDVRAMLPDGEQTAEWRYSAKAGTSVTITLFTSFTGGSISLGRVTNGRFTTELDRELTSSTSSGVPDGMAHRATLSYKLSETGEYAVRIGSPRVAPKRRYQLSLAERVPRPAQPQQRPLAHNVDVQGMLDETDAGLGDASPYEEWKYDAKEGEELVVTMRSAAFDPVVAIGERNANGEFIMWASNDDASGTSGKDARVVMTVRKAGRFIIRANTFGPDQSGAYTIRLWPSPAAVDSALAAIASAKTVLDSLTTLAGQYDTRGRAQFAADSFAAAVATAQKRVAIWREIHAKGATTDSRTGLAGSYWGLSWYLLFAGKPADALASAEAGLRTSPTETLIETNRAHALLLLNRPAEAAVVYQDYRGQTFGERTWEQIIRTDLADLQQKKVLTPVQAQLVESWLNGAARPAGAIWDAKPVAGRWIGTYTCAQGETGLTLTITAGTMGKVDALFEFEPLESNPSVPSGSYRMKGWYTRDGTLELVGTEWIDRPGETWSMVGLFGRVAAGGRRIEGTVPECRASFAIDRR